MRYTKTVMLQDNYGVISGIQEPGFKLRAVANPDRVIQAMLEPLKRAVMDHLKTLPFDHTHDQTAAIPKVQEMLRSGKRVHSVDLSDATNLFPLPLQVDLLRKMLPPQYEEFISIFERVSSGNWLTKLRGEPEIVRFSRGQPLGLGPSFGVFALAHGTLLEGLCERLALKPEDHFVILGDDVVIRGNALNDSYRATLANLGCVVSESKTLSSTKLAEFAGFVILPDMVGKGYKWRDLSDHSFLDMVKALGPSVQGFLHPWQRDVVRLLAPVPIQLGGLGWSGDRTLAQALELPITGNLIKVLLDREKELMLFRDPIPVATRVIYALQEKSFLPYYRMEDPTPIKGSGVSSAWPALNIIEADKERALNKPRPEFLLAEKGDPMVKSYSLVNKPIGDPRPGSLTLLKSVLGVDPDFRQYLSSRLRSRLETKEHTPAVVFSTTVEPPTKPRERGGMSMG